MPKKSFLFYLDSLGIVEKMPNEFAGKWIKIIANWQINGTLPDMDFAMEMAVIPFINQFKRDDINYNLTSEKNKENGLKGGRPVGSMSNKPKKPTGLIGNPKKPIEAKKAYKDKDKDKDKDLIHIKMFHPFQKWITENCPRVSTLIKNQLTYEEAERLAAEFDKELLKTKLQAMENKKVLDYVSVNLTLRNWLKKEEIHLEPGAKEIKHGSVTFKPS